MNYCCTAIDDKWTDRKGQGAGSVGGGCGRGGGRGEGRGKGERGGRRRSKEMSHAFFLTNTSEYCFVSQRKGIVHVKCFQDGVEVLEAIACGISADELSDDGLVLVANSSANSHNALLEAQGME